MWREELLACAEAVVDFDEIETCAYGRSELQSCEQDGNTETLGTHTTASMIVASSHQNPWTIHTRVTIRRKRKSITSTRKAMVKRSMEGPQLPSLVGETEFVMVRATFEMYSVGELAVVYNDYC